MALSADIKLTQGPNTAAAGDMVFGTLTDGPVVCTLANVLGAPTSYVWRLVSVAPSSGVAAAVFSTSSSGSWSQPDVRGGYLVECTISDGTTTIVLRNSLVVPEASGRWIPPLGADENSLKVGGAGRGWDASMVPWLRYVDTISGPTAGDGLTGLTSFAVKPNGPTIGVSAAGVKVADNQIGNTQLRQGAACSIIGRSANAPGNVADITATADGQVGQRIAGAIVFAQLDLTANFASCARVETGSATERGLVAGQVSNDAKGARIGGYKQRGTVVAPTAHASLDSLIELFAEGYDGAAKYEAGRFEFFAAQAGGTSKQSGFRVWCHDGNALILLSYSLPWRATTGDATPLLVASFDLPASTFVTFSGTWHGKDVSGNELSFEMSTRIRRVGSGTPGEIGTRMLPFGVAFKDDASWGDPTFVVNTSTNKGEIWVTGKASTNITWDGDYTVRLSH